MLDQLYIENFAIIDKVTVDFSAGLNAITGETGSGKSIIIEALELLTGERFQKRMVKTEGKRTVVEGTFSPSKKKRRRLADRGFTDELLTITRIIDEKGRSRAYVNGRLQNLSVIREMTSELIDIHGQNENQSLMRKDEYIKLIDRHDKKTSVLKERIGEILDDIDDLKKRLDSFTMDPADREREIDLLKYQREELDLLDLENFDEEELNRQFDKINALGDIKKSLSALETLFSGGDYGESGIVADLSSAVQEIEEIEDFDEELKETADRIRSAFYETEDLARELSLYRDGLTLDEEELYEINREMSIFTDLKRKYGDNVDELLSYRQKIEDRLDELDDVEAHRREITKQIRAKEEKGREIAEELSSIRKKIARRLEGAILSNLKDLNMKSAEFVIDFTEKELSYDGIDEIEFLLKTNPGGTLQPMRYIASGGEMSRIMLGFKAVLADVDELDTLIFDEIDTGISGRTAQIVGEKILDIAGDHQVIVISHLPQIAALSDHHLLIEKVEGKDDTISNVRTIADKNRVEELARIIAGVDITETTRKQAEEMLRQAERLRKERK